MNIDQKSLGTFVSKPTTMIKAGHELGSGCFGTVTEATIPGFVVKTVDNFWVDGWFPWALYCMKHQGEVGIPTIVALRLDFNEGKLWALMERLQERPWSSGPDYRIQEDRETFMARCDYVFGRLKSVPQHVKNVLNALPDQGLFVDLHRFNYMLRGKKLIVTDPLILTNGGWLRDQGIKGQIKGLEWARQTLVTFFPNGDPRISIVGTPEAKAEEYRQKLQAEKDAIARRKRKPKDPVAHAIEMLNDLVEELLGN